LGFGPPFLKNNKTNEKKEEIKKEKKEKKRVTNLFVLFSSLLGA